MTRRILAIAILAALSACSNWRNRSSSVTEDQTQPARDLRIAAPDTSETRDSLRVSSRDSQPVSPVEEQQTPKPVTVAGARKSNRRPSSPPPRTSADTIRSQAYAPAGPADSSESHAAADSTVSATTADTGRDVESSPLTETAIADTTAPAKRDSSLGATAASQRTLPVGTEIRAALDDSISSRRDSAGRSITAQVTDNVTGAGGQILVPAGSTVHLTVTRLGPSKSKSSQGQLGMRVDGIELGGEVRKVEGNVQPVSRELRGRGVTGGDAAKVGAGAAGGAVLGGVIGGNTKGAVIGGVVGAAGGAVVASQTATRDVVVKAKTPVVFVLTAPFDTP
jgi:hypothetical protein